MKNVLLKLALTAMCAMGCGHSQFSAAAPPSPLHWTDHPAATPLARKIDFALLQAADQGNTAQVKRLVSQGANIDATTADTVGRTALMFASWKGHRSTVKFLLDKGANWKIKDKGKRGAFEYSVVAGHVAIMDMLVDKGAK
jgi:ankyrin repeat protein